MRKLIIIGAGGHGKVVADIAQKMNVWQEIAFLDDKTVSPTMGCRVIGPSSEALNYISEHAIFIAIGSNAIREKIMLQLKSAGAALPLLIHPTAVIGRDVEIAAGTVVMAGAIINSGSKIGMGCIVNTGATVDHDCFLDDFVHVSPGAHLAGMVRIGRGSWVGIGAVVSNNIEIAGGTMLGAGAAVVKDIQEAGTYVGVPARRI